MNRRRAYYAGAKQNVLRELKISGGDASRALGLRAWRENPNRRLHSGAGVGPALFHTLRMRQYMMTGFKDKILNIFHFQVMEDDAALLDWLETLDRFSLYTPSWSFC